MDKSSNAVLASVVAVAIAVCSLFYVVTHTGGPSAVTSDGQQVGGEQAGVQNFYDGAKLGNVGSKWIARNLAQGENSVRLYCNTSGRDAVIHYGEVTYPTGQTASSTYTVNIFATTTTSIPATQNFTSLAEGRRSLIQVSVATSSTATTTSSIYAARANQGNGSVLVASNSCVFGYLQQLGPTCNGASCETATSSNRGVNPVFQIQLHEGAETSGTIAL